MKFVVKFNTPGTTTFEARLFPRDINSGDDIKTENVMIEN